MNWNTATDSEVKSACELSMKQHRPIMASPAWIIRMMRERLDMARLAADEPQFSNSIDAWDARRVRDTILSEAST